MRYAAVLRGRAREGVRSLRRSTCGDDVAPESPTPTLPPSTARVPGKGGIPSTCDAAQFVARTGRGGIYFFVSNASTYGSARRPAPSMKLVNGGVFNPTT